jgi:hypothetical protein
MAPHWPVDDGHPLFAVVELLQANPPLATLLAGSTIVTAGLGAVVWMLLSGALITRLHGERDPQGIGSAWLASLPRVIVTSGWHLLVRAVVLLVVVVATSTLGSTPLLIALILALLISSGALDVARVHVVLHDAPGYHPKTALRAFGLLLKRPRVLASFAGLWLVQIGIAGSIAVLGLRGLGSDAMMLGARAAALAGTFIGLWRLAVVVHAAPLLFEPPADG